MLLTKEQLIESGLTEEQAAKVLKSIDTAFNGKYISKADHDSMKEKLEKDIKERDGQLDTLRKSTEGNDGVNIEDLNQKIKDLQEANDIATTKYADDLKELQLSSAIKLSLNGKVHDEDITAGLINKEQLVIGTDGKVIGLEEQLTSLKESKAFLFKETVEFPEGKKRQKYTPPAGGTNKQSIGKSIAESMNNTESSNPYANAWGAN